MPYRETGPLRPTHTRRLRSAAFLSLAVFALALGAPALGADDSANDESGGTTQVNLGFDGAPGDSARAQQQSQLEANPGGDCPRCALERAKSNPVPRRTRRSLRHIAYRLSAWPNYSSPRPRGGSYYSPETPAAAWRGRVTEQGLAGERTSLIEAPANRYTDPEKVQELVNYALRHRSLATHGTGRCWKFVRQAIEKTMGLPAGKLSNLPGKGHSRARALIAAGLINITSRDLVLHPEHAPEGSVIVYGGPHSDVQIRTKNGYVSDHYWPVAFSHQSNRLRNGFGVVAVLVIPGTGA